MKKEILNHKDIERIISRMTHEIVEYNKGVDALCLVGIQRGGVYLANRIAQKINTIEYVNLPLGMLDISLYRDDISIKKTRTIVRKTDIPFDISDKKVILIDDVLFTGRSIRAAMDALMDMGRPSQIQLAILIDRGHRELPIRADFVGKSIPTSKKERITVTFSEDGSEDKVFIEKTDRGNN
ncbi:MAG TPA: bifunctional pyr operon transcriptional regulator/uracil phosphoribosyltransferase PyrR [Nitrospirae bacterium]|nr:bifunctional pyr operon transcriptional regulator/uracil phosphoribosyltransferase PyrR [Nitrospirota bacterium]